MSLTDSYESYMRVGANDQYGHLGLRTDFTHIAMAVSGTESFTELGLNCMQWVPG